MQNTSATLLQRVRDPRDAEAWGTFFGLYFPMLQKYARRTGLGAADAEEVAQECMKTLSRHMRRLRYSRARGRFKGFLRTMVDHQVANLYRRKRPRQARTGELDGLASPEASRAAWDRVWLREHLAYCIKRLASRYSDQTVQAFRLYALEGWPVEKVCRTLDLSPNQVYLAKTRIVRRLRKETAQLIGEVL